MEKEKNIMKMEILDMKVIMLMVNLKEMENIFLEMANIMRVNLKMISEMEKEKNIIKMEILNLKGIIEMRNLKEKENYIMKMVN